MSQWSENSELGIVSVHRFLYESRLGPSGEEVLELGQLLTRAAIHSEGWSIINHATSEYQYGSTSATSAQVYTFTDLPSELTGTATSGRHDIKEWGTPADTDELAALEDLEEFESSDLSSIFQAAAARKNVKPKDIKIRPRKRRRIESVEPSLYTLIPQPHYRPQLPHRHMSNSYLEEYGMTSYPISRLVPLDPEIDPMDFLSEDNTNARCSWTIPVRGDFAWDSATPARIVDSDDPTQLGVHNVETIDGTKESYICWSPNALRAFWDFLLLYYIKGDFGPIALSFQPAMPADAMDEEEDGVPARPLECDYTDFISVYHDAHVSLRLRNLLISWKYRGADGDQNGQKPSHRGVRVLQGAKLVLQASGQAICVG